MLLLRIALFLFFTWPLQAQVFTNGGFEFGTAGWRVWSRTEKACTLEATRDQAQGSANCALVQHRGEQDWSLEPFLKVPVQPGEIYELQIRARIESGSEATLCVSTWDERNRNVEWSYGDRTATGPGDWQWVKTRFIVPPGVSHIQPRVIGNGPIKVRFDDFEIRKQADMARASSVPPALAISNRLLSVTLDTAKVTLSVTDTRSGRIWRQKGLAPALFLTDASVASGALQWRMVHVASGLEYAARLQLESAAPEFLVNLEGAGDMPSTVPFPLPFEGQNGEHLVIPMNEGISFPVNDTEAPLHRLVAYGGHGICMPFWGVTDGKAGHMAIIETPDDASIQMARSDGRLVIAPQWEPQRGQFGYTRKLRYVFLNQGGHVAIAKRYRAYAQQTGLLKTLAQKREQIPAVDLLIGAVNVWCWDRNPVDIVQEMQAAGIDRILWSNAQPPENLKRLNELGVLTSRYDIYQDVMNPAEFPRLRYTHKDWTTAAWPNDIILDRRGNWIKGWGIETKDNGPMVYCGVLCDKRAISYAKDRVPAELVTHPYKSRFIDTTTAAPWHECYHTNHPMTRSESRHWKMELLRYMSEEAKLVTGSETGHDAAVPFVHYFEGMLSLGPFRVPDSGRKMQQIWTNVPPLVAKYQVGHQYRLPLWELVYHDCVVAQWYWGDYNNKLPAIWTKRDLFNVLYGTPPMFMFERNLWRENKDRFVESYKNICPHVRKSGYSEMVEHRFLTADRSVQQTVFANGQQVTVNFGEKPFLISSGNALPPLSFKVIQE